MKKKSTITPKEQSARKARAPKKMEPVTKTFVENEVDELDEDIEQPERVTPVTEKESRKKWFILAAVVLIAAVAFFRYRYLLTPVVVNGQPIYVWQYFGKLHEQFGQEQLNAMATESMIEQAVRSANVTVPTVDVDKEIAKIELEASSSGGINAILEAQQLSLTELKRRIELQLAVKKILADKITVTDQEVNETFTTNKDFYKSMPEAQAKQMVRQQLEDQKFQQEVSNWINEIRSKANIQIKFPGIES